MKLLIDTEKKTIEAYGDDLALEVMPLLAPFAIEGYTVIRAPQSLLGSVSKIEYNSDSTDKPITKNNEQTKRTRRSISQS